MAAYVAKISFFDKCSRGERVCMMVAPKFRVGSARCFYARDCILLPKAIDLLNRTNTAEVQTTLLIPGQAD